MRPSTSRQLCRPAAVALFSLLLLSRACALPSRLEPSRATQAHSQTPLDQINVAAIREAPQSGIRLHLNSTLLQESGQWFELLWSGVPQPSYADWIGLIVPAGCDVTKTAPATFKLAALDASHLTKGRGRLAFRLLNHRAPMQFGFFRHGLAAPLLAARSPIINVKDVNEPTQRHLALTGDNTQMLVQWVSGGSRRPVVRWGAAPGRLAAVTPAASSGGYSRGELCGPPANSTGWIHPGTFHTALLEGLEPGRRYYYSVGDEAGGPFSPEAAFSAPPPAGPAVSVALLAVADLGQGRPDGAEPGPDQQQQQASLETTARLLADTLGQADSSSEQQTADGSSSSSSQGSADEPGYQLLLHNGDISYALGYVALWDNFMHQLEPIVSRLPYMTIPGNHERDWPGSGDRFQSAADSGGECGIPFERRLQMPLSGRDKPWYSFDFGPIHFLQYSTEHAFQPGSEQHAWVLADLAGVDRSRTPWLLVGGHRPIYVCSTNDSPGDGDQPVAEDLRAAFEEAFVRYKVDLTLHGHHHSYQRTCPTRGGGKCHPLPATSSSSSGGRVYASPGAPVHVVIGNGGADLSLNVQQQPDELWEVIRLAWGHARITANASHLTLQAVAASNGRLLDAFSLTKPPPPPPAAAAGSPSGTAAAVLAVTH